MDKPIDNAEGAAAEGTTQAQEGAVTPAETGTPDGHQGEGPQTLMDAIKSVVPDGDDPDEIDLSADGEAQAGAGDAGATPAPATTEKEGKEGAASADADDENADFSAEDMKGVPERTQKRIKTLLRQRGKFRDEVAAMRPQAEGFRQITAFMEESDLSGEEVAQGMSVMAALKRGDRKMVAEGLSSVLEPLGYRLTPVLPADVQEMLDSGDISEAAAQRMADERHAGRQHQYEAQRATRRQQQEMTTRQQAALRQSQEHALGVWQQQVMASDPDFEKKIGLVEQGVRAISAQRGPAKSAEQVVQYAQEAYAAVNAHLNSLRPPAPAGTQRQPTKPVPGSVTGTSRPLSAEPRSLMEAMHQGLRRAG